VLVESPPAAVYGGLIPDFGGAEMAIAVYFNPEAMTAEQYDQTMAALEAGGAGSPAGRIHHSCFGVPDHLMVYDVWESAEAFEAFGESLGPILAQLDVDVGEPDIMPMHNHIS
jgi:hypothetical protein